jgi:Leucine-rich repeat (LRR) protein
VAACPTVCDCGPESGVVLNCQVRGIVNVNDVGPALTNSTTTVLFHNNLIVELPARMFGPAARPSLQLLVFNSNQLTRIDPDAFELLQGLTALHLYNNWLTEIPMRALQPLINLESLELRSNHLTAMPALPFMPRLEAYILDGNRISPVTRTGLLNVSSTLKMFSFDGNYEFRVSFDADIFANCSQLAMVIMSSNLISELPDGIFAPIAATLTDLNLSDNLLTTLPSSLFTALTLGLNAL